MFFFLILGLITINVGAFLILPLFGVGGTFFACLICLASIVYLCSIRFTGSLKNISVSRIFDNLYADKEMLFSIVEKALIDTNINVQMIDQRMGVIVGRSNEKFYEVLGIVYNRFFHDRFDAGIKVTVHIKENWVKFDVDTDGWSHSSTNGNIISLKTLRQYNRMPEHYLNIISSYFNNNKELLYENYWLVITLYTFLGMKKRKQYQGMSLLP